MKHQNPNIFKGSFVGLLIALRFFTSLLPAQDIVTTYAGDGFAGLQDGDTLTAEFDQPSDIDRDPFGNLIIVDLDNVIRKISPGGIVTTLAGNGVAGWIDAQGGNARFNGALNACVDSVGNVYVSDFSNQRIRKIDVNGYVTTIAGNGVAGYKDTTALAASFRFPRGICMDNQGNLYIADSWNHRIRKLDPNGNVTTFAGGGTSVGVQSPGDWVDGPDTSARFWTPCGLEIDPQGNLYLADAYNHRIRKITPQGLVTTLAGSGPGGSANGAYLDSTALYARFNTPTGLGVDANGDLYVADTYNNCIRRVENGVVLTTAGSTTAGFLNGNAHDALFNHPRSVLMAPSGNVMYTPDGNNHVIRKITLSLLIGMEGPIATQLYPSIYPNPASTQMRIHLPEGISLDHATISILDLSGKTVMGEREFMAGDAMDVSTLPAGLYLAQLKADGKFHRLKFVKD
jgi:sugar lactone lactonase YvrE